MKTIKAALIGTDLSTLAEATRIAEALPNGTCLVLLEDEVSPKDRLTVESNAIGQPSTAFSDFHAWCMAQDLPSIDPQALKGSGHYFFTRFALNTYFDVLWDQDFDDKIVRISTYDWFEQEDGTLAIKMGNFETYVPPELVALSRKTAPQTFPLADGLTVFDQALGQNLPKAFDQALTVALIGENPDALRSTVDRLIAEGYDGDCVLVGSCCLERDDRSMPAQLRSIEGKVSRIGRFMSRTADIKIDLPSGQQRSVLADIVILA